MYIKNYSTKEAIPYASYEVRNSSGLRLTAGNADASGYINNALVLPYNFNGNTIVISSAGYSPHEFDITSATASEEMYLEENGGGLAEVIVTAKRKIKENPYISIALIVVVILLIVYRKKIFK